MNLHKKDHLFKWICIRLCNAVDKTEEVYITLQTTFAGQLPPSTTPVHKVNAPIQLPQPTVIREQKNTKI
jgi:hypothetical protein